MPSPFENDGHEWITGIHRDDQNGAMEPPTSRRHAHCVAPWHRGTAAVGGQR